MNGLAPLNPWLTCPEVADLLAQLDGQLKRAIDGHDFELREAAGLAMLMRGKRIRPALLFLAAAYGRAASQDLLRAGVAVELMHAASLFHDDVMDRAAMRRHAPSANALWGNGCATLTGTWLFSRAMLLLAALGDAVNRHSAAAAAALCSGQLLEVDNAYNMDLPEPGRLEILRRKTATLFELPCRLGAELASCTREHSQALVGYGRDLGLAFQLADDALDFTGDPAKTGKAIGTDLRQGIYSVPVMRALQANSAATELSDLLQRTSMTDAELGRAVELVQASGSVSQVLAMSRDHAARATRRLRVLPNGPQRSSLQALAEYAVARTQ